MDGELNLDSILTEDQIAELELGNGDEGNNGDNVKQNSEIVDTEDLTAEDLFKEDGSEGSEKVGDDDEKEDEIKEEKKPDSKQAEETSPDNLYSSIAEAMVDEGFFSDFKDDVKNCNNASDLLKLIDKHVKSQLDDTQKRVSEALENGVNPSVISRTERTIKYLDSIDDEAISDESDNGVKLRQQLIYNDYISKGFSQKKASDLTKRAFDDGTDVDDAKEALESYSKRVKDDYNKLLEDAKNEKQKIVDENNKRKENLKKMILEGKETFGEDISQNTRQRIFDIATKAYRKDKESGDYLTELEIYEQEHPVDFLANVAYYFAITDGFKTKNGFTKRTEKKIEREGLKKLERVINGTQRNSDGSLRLIGGRNESSYLEGDEIIDL